MQYFAGGYPGSYFPVVVILLAPPVLADVTVEIPMHIVTGGPTRPTMMTPQVEQAMAITPRLTIPMTRGMAARIEIPARVTTVGRYVPPSVPVAPKIPMRIVTGGATRAARIPRTATLPATLGTTVEVAMTRGMAERAVLPMRIRTSASLEH
jgi:hypothetical protein